MRSIQACYNNPVMRSRAGWPPNVTRSKPSPHYLRQIWLQIYLPLFVCLLLLIGLVVFFRAGAVGTASAWADASMVFLLMPVILFGLLFALVCIALAIGLGYLIGWLPGNIRKGWEASLHVASAVRRGADLAVRPMISAKGMWFSMRSSIDAIMSIFRAE